MEPLKLQNIPLPHRAVFGPMAGFTDAPCRRLRVVGDASSLEVFLNDGAAVLSTRYYPAPGPAALCLTGCCGTLYEITL